MKRFALILAALALLVLAASCGGPSYETVTLPLDTLKEYTIIRADAGHEEFIDSAIRLRSSLGEILGADPVLTTDWIKRGTELAPTGKEILVGITNRAESDTAGMRAKDFFIGYENERIVLLGLTADAVDTAVDYFLAECVDAASGQLILPAGEGYLCAGDYPITTLMLGDKEISSYSLKISGSTVASEAAALFKTTLAELTGWILPTAEADDENVIVIGNQNPTAHKLRSRDTYTGFDGKTFLLAGSTPDTCMAAVKAFIGKHLTDKTGKVTVPAEGIYQPGDYIFESLSINGTPIDEFGLASADSDEARAAKEELRTAIAYLTGFTLTDRNSGSRIVIGEGKAKAGVSTCAYTAADGNLYVDGGEGMLSVGCRALLAAVTDLGSDPTASGLKRGAVIDAEVKLKASEISKMEKILIYVDKNGSDEGKGTKDSPLKTLEAAHEMARCLSMTTPAPVDISLDFEDYGVTSHLSMDRGDAKKASGDAKAVVEKYLPGVICWGDSLTAGGYPTILTTLISCNAVDGVTAVNRGVGGETSATIVGRSGAIPYVTDKEFTIPAGAEKVEITFKLEDGKNVAPLRQGNRGMESVTIDGIEGTMTIVQESYISPEYHYFFQRSKSGEAHTVKAGTEIVTKAKSEFLDYIPVIFIGQNGGYTDFEDLIRQQRAIIERQTGPDGRFVIVGLHTGTAESRAALEEAMEAEYGENYLNLREYMSTVAIHEAGVVPTLKDYQMMAEGSTPESLLRDGCHFTNPGNELLAKVIFAHMEKLGFFDEVREAVK